MFNSYNVSNPQEVNINAVSGTMIKNYKDSFILRFDMRSNMADKILDKNPTLYKGSYGEDKPVVVLQVMLCGDKQLLAEVMWKEDFDKLFEPSFIEPKETAVDIGKLAEQVVGYGLSEE
jgi:hypothetical protein